MGEVSVPDDFRRYVEKKEDPIALIQNNESHLLDSTPEVFFKDLIRRLVSDKKREKHYGLVINQDLSFLESLPQPTSKFKKYKRIRIVSHSICLVAIIFALIITLFETHNLSIYPHEMLILQTFARNEGIVLIGVLMTLLILRVYKPKEDHIKLNGVVIPKKPFPEMPQFIPRKIFEIVIPAMVDLRGFWFFCSECGGRGTSMQRCPDCRDGMVWADTEPGESSYTIQCPTCNGTKRAEVKCATCGGQKSFLIEPYVDLYNGKALRANMIIQNLEKSQKVEKLNNEFIIPANERIKTWNFKAELFS